MAAWVVDGGGGGGRKEGRKEDDGDGWIEDEADKGKRACREHIVL